MCWTSRTDDSVSYHGPRFESQTGHYLKSPSFPSPILGFGLAQVAMVVRKKGATILTSIFYVATKSIVNGLFDILQRAHVFIRLSALAAIVAALKGRGHDE